MSGSSSAQAGEEWIATIESGKGYGIVDAPTFRSFIERMKKYTFFGALLRHLAPGATVLEAGCGWAMASFALAARGFTVTAIDISDKLIRELQAMQKQLGGAYATHLTFSQGDIFALKDLHQTFDAVFSDGTYEHFLNLEDRKKILENTSEVLRDGGMFIVAVPNQHNPFFRMAVDRKMPAMHPFRIEELASELSAHGYNVVETGFAFVNPGFEQWITSRWMVHPIRVFAQLFPLLPRFAKKILGAHMYCVTRKA